MATVKLTATRGKPDLKDVAVAAGTTVGAGDAMELNIDYTKMTKGDALVMIDAIRAKIFAAKWPVLP